MAQQTAETETNSRRQLKLNVKVKVRDDDYYIPHVPSDFHSEKGLSVGSSVFESQAASAVLDLEGDEGEGLQRHKQQMKWCALLAVWLFCCCLHICLLFVSCYE